MMVKPVICDLNSKNPVLPEYCEDSYWEVPVTSLAEVKEVNRDHAYISPDESIWVLNHEGNGMI
ncbi:hypothetical protein [Enterococcus sp. CWB-B31]|uniref:hypothetical protein n=1 Tax=Enterococcus sp. CWB-B31 TaxID=2885159 RepID=UPI001E3A2E38|nr:hypothetical protein [Enterococcus sp. CWB-B31]MCB5954005.1 hypothetical protein [Enterococcus sp. CWB-B31]